jgi:hypothetical protein
MHPPMTDSHTKCLGIGVPAVVYGASSRSGGSKAVATHALGHRRAVGPPSSTSSSSAMCASRPPPRSHARTRSTTPGRLRRSRTSEMGRMAPQGTPRICLRGEPGRPDHPGRVLPRSGLRHGPRINGFASGGSRHAPPKPVISQCCNVFGPSSFPKTSRAFRPFPVHTR